VEARDLHEHAVQAVNPESASLDCRISWIALSPHGRYRMTAAVSDAAPVEVEASDLFEALRQVRLAFESRGVLLCCAGARRDVWPSGMQRDMGEGRVAYVLTLPRTAERPPRVGIFDPAPRETIATVAEQEAFARRWMDSPRES
jgi:hypothetical protein